jgi:DNA-directed RNA polymerase specialized sigma24 family protein
MKHLFLRMVDQYQQLGYSQAMFILSNKADAEDASQETYECLWGVLNKPRPSKEFSAESAKALLELREAEI